MSLPRRARGWQSSSEIARPRHAADAQPDEPQTDRMGPRRIRTVIAVIVIAAMCGGLTAGSIYQAQHPALALAADVLASPAAVAAPTGATPIADSVPDSQAEIAERTIAIEEAADQAELTAGTSDNSDATADVADPAGVDASPVETAADTEVGTQPTVESTPAEPLSARTQYVTTGLRLRAGPGTDAVILGTLALGTPVTSIGEAANGWQQVTVEDRQGFVSADYLSDTAPATPPPAPASSSYPACRTGSAVESGLTARAITLHRAVCSTFSTPVGYGGYRAGSGEHGTGRAVDIMVSGANGREIAAWLRANAGTLGVIEIIYEQKIWTLQRSGEGWRAMANRGSATANHYDHIHVLVRS
ncbi:MAG: SH3 domain-containing protein [Arachnia sp.]